jgi:hypothetical protein
MVLMGPKCRGYLTTDPRHPGKVAFLASLAKVVLFSGNFELNLTNRLLSIIFYRDCSVRNKIVFFFVPSPFSEMELTLVRNVLRKTQYC